MNLNLGKFKKKSEDEHSATLVHPEGHQIKIAKRMLSKDNLHELSKLPVQKFEDGGEALPLVGLDKPAYDPDAASLQLLQNPSIGDSVKQAILDKKGSSLSVDQVNKALPQTAAHPDMPDAPVPEESSPPPGMAPVSATPGDQNALRAQKLIQPAAPSAPADNGIAQNFDQYTQGIKGDYGQQIAGQQNLAKAEGQIGQEQSDILKKGVQQQQEQMQDFHTHIKGLSDEYQNFIKDYKDFHIDPQHYLNSMGTGQKIATGIGLILGGLGGANTGTNPSVDYLNKQIDNDINAQKAEMDKKNNLLAANYRQFGNVNQAAQMTKAMQQGIVIDQLQQVAAKYQDPVVKARAQAAIGQIGLDRDKTLFQLGQQTYLMKAAQGASNNGQSNPDQKVAQQIGTLRILNPEMAKSLESRYVPTVGVGSIPVPDKVREELTGRQNLDNAVADLKQFAEQNHGTLLDRATVVQGKAKAKLVQDAYRRANAQGVFREAEKNFVEGIVDQDPTKFFASFRTLPKYKELSEDNMRQLNTLKSSYGLPARFIPTDVKR